MDQNEKVENVKKWPKMSKITIFEKNEKTRFLIIFLITLFQTL